MCSVDSLSRICHTFVGFKKHDGKGQGKEHREKKRKEKKKKNPKQKRRSGRERAGHDKRTDHFSGSSSDSFMKSLSTRAKSNTS